jgi:hypothetical protein
MIQGTREMSLKENRLLHPGYARQSTRYASRQHPLLMTFVPIIYLQHALNQLFKEFTNDF